MLSSTGYRIEEDEQVRNQSLMGYGVYHFLLATGQVGKGSKFPYNLDPLLYGQSYMILS